MRKLWLTARHEMRTTLGRRSFWLTTFLLPAVVMALVLIPQLSTLGAQGSGGVPGIMTGGEGRFGYVDEARLLHTFPTDLPPGLAREYETEASARSALERGEIDRYYVLPSDYVESGRLTVVQARYRPLQALEGRTVLSYVVNTGLSGDETIAVLLADPTPRLSLRPQAPGEAEPVQDPLLAYMVPYVMMFIFYASLAMTSGFMLQSVTKEKENRTAEVLLVSLRPRDLMLGKIGGLSLVALLQVAVWFGVGFGFFGREGGFAGVTLTITGAEAARMVPWAIAYFVLGYVMYASIYSVFGVLSPTARDANQYVFVAILPLIVPLLFLNSFADAPDGTLATFLSLFPLTSPMAMVARLGTTEVPWWQLSFGLVGLVLSAYLFVMIAGQAFRADNLLSSRALSWSRLRGELRPGGVAAGGPRKGGGTEAVGLDRRATPPQDASARSPARRQVYARALAATVLVVVGVQEVARGDTTAGALMVAAGAVIGATAFRSYRKR